MGTRIDLHEELCSLLGSRNVYFQPPENTKLVYPCIVYKLTTIESRYANNNHYTNKKLYEVSLITKNPDSDTVEIILNNFIHCSVNRMYIFDNLYHYVYHIYY